MADGTLGLIGAGRLASALVAGWVGADPACAARILATDRVEGVAEALGTGVRATPAEVAAEADLVLLLVKPQDIAGAARDVGAALRAGAAVASAAAGIELATVRAELPAGTPVARFMPNIPFAVGGGVAGVCGDEAAVSRLASWLEGAGTVVAVDEALFDAVTAISGSGPGLLAYVVEALADAARAVGFDDADAERLAVMTFAGTGRYLAETGESATALRERVTSPGGTTAAGIAALEAAGLHEALTAAAIAARDRGIELRSGG
jgi:pyrroline-5-carboxylate reductase